MVVRLVQADDRVTEAIRAAESRTSGEIFCVMTDRVSSYRDVALAWAVAATLVLPLALIPLGFDPAWLPGMGSSWEAAHLAARSLTVGQALLGYAMIQALILIAVFGLLAWTPFNLRIAPRALRRQRVRQAAMMQFLAHGVHQTRERTGVLIFASTLDRQVEIVADDGIHALVDRDAWGRIAADLARQLRAGDVLTGFEDAVVATGALLAEHFPPREDDVNELHDRMIVL